MTDHLLRSVLFAEILRKGDDKAQRRIIEGFKGELEFTPLDTLMISAAAWDHVAPAGCRSATTRPKKSLAFITP